MDGLVKALEKVKELDGTPAQVDIVNISMSGEKLVDGLNEILSELAKTKILISSAGNRILSLLKSSMY